MSDLTVYKASAGSGKTFTLALEYIKLLIENPYAYRNILAVTFTNKATDEMKNRILRCLYGIAHGLSDADDYLNKIRKTTGYGDAQIRERAALALSLLIHNYDFFKVETIDSFFQGILRNLARELDLSANLRLELNARQVEEQAVDHLIERLDKRSPLFKWLLRFIMENISDNKTWNVIGQLKHFGLMVFKTEYRNESRRLSEVMGKKDFIARYKEELLLLKESQHGPLMKKHDEYFSALAQRGIDPDEVKERSVVISDYFRRLVTEDITDDGRFLPNTIAKCINGQATWANAKNKNREQIAQAGEECLREIIASTEKLRLKARETMLSIDVTLDNLNNLRILNDIENEVRALNTETNRFLLNDTQHLLAEMIAESDSPFIYEKIGTRLSHIMIDEFQDTGTVQWKNFKLLLDECMSHAQPATHTVNNLIVGDIKQSIYRWRDGDWRLLNNIASHFPGRDVGIRSLKFNFRSSRNVVDFNNCFFEEAIRKESENEAAAVSSPAVSLSVASYPELIHDIYLKKDPSLNNDNDILELTDGKKLTEEELQEVWQLTKEESGGEVVVKLLAADNYQEETLAEIERTVCRLINEKDVKQNDIAILLRNNKNIGLIADYFMLRNTGINVVSDEAFRLDHSVAVSTLIAALRYLYEGENAVSRALLIKNYQLYVVKNESLKANDILSDTSEGTLLPAELREGSDQLLEEPLYDLVEKLYRILGLQAIKGENAYVCAFFDQLSAYIKDMSADAIGFLKEWDQSICSKTIQADGVEGIRLLTIHSSKGLEFDNVIIPFSDWMLENYLIKRYVWCHPKEAPFNQLPVIPLTYSTKLKSTIYADEYTEEHAQNTIDNLNLLYVAFTRAGNNLYVLGKRKVKGTNFRSVLIRESLPQITEKLNALAEKRQEQLMSMKAENIPPMPHATLTGWDDEEEDIVFYYGSFQKKKDKKKPQEGNVFITSYEPYNVGFTSNDIPLNFRQSNKSKEFVGCQQDDAPSDNRSYIKMGNLMHSIFSRIRTIDDIPSVINEYEQEGLLYEDGLDSEKLTTMLLSRIKANEQIADWFAPHWTLFNECTILSKDVNTGNVIDRRPDRVMKDGQRVVVVDFKFGSMHGDYIPQVSEYIQLIRAMGYTDVRGYLWLVNENKVIEVKPEKK